MTDIADTNSETNESSKAQIIAEVKLRITGAINELVASIDGTCAGDSVACLREIHRIAGTGLELLECLGCEPEGVFYS